MLKDIQVTLYDIFGYLVPGVVFVIGIVVIFWAIFLPSVPAALPQALTDNWLILLIFGYVGGHMTQALANTLTRLTSTSKRPLFSARTPNHLPPALVAAATGKVSAILDIEETEISTDLLYQVYDEMTAQFGVTSDRDIYIYREGFYRGLTISSLVLAIGLTLRAFIPGTILDLSGTLQAVSRAELSFAVVAMVIVAWLSYERFKRFGLYRVTQAVIGSLLIMHKMKLQPKG